MLCEPARRYALTNYFTGVFTLRKNFRLHVFSLVCIGRRQNRISNVLVFYKDKNTKNNTRFVKQIKYDYIAFRVSDASCSGVTVNAVYRSAADGFSANDPGQLGQVREP